MAPGGSMDGQVDASASASASDTAGSAVAAFWEAAYGSGMWAVGREGSRAVGWAEGSHRQQVEQASGQHLLHDDRATRRYDSSPPWPVQQEGGSVRDLSVGWRAED
jgi:hypothetical protein